MIPSLTIAKAHFVHIGLIWTACILLGLSANAQINATFDVFSMAGHHCKQIAYAEVGGAQDHWYWDGSTDDGGVLPPDFYILTMQGLNALSPPRCSVPILVMY